MLLASSPPETSLLPAEAGALQPHRLLDQFRDVCCYKHHSLLTQATDAGWVRRFRFYKQVLRVDLGHFGDFAWARSARYLPVVLTRPEASALIDALLPPWRLMALLLYDIGLRLMECLRLRTKDFDFGCRQICVRDGTPGVEMPYALGRKYPNAAVTWDWFWVFPAPGLSVDPRSGIVPSIISTRLSSSGPSKWRSKKRAFINRRLPFAIVLPPICWKAATTSAPCRNCLAIRMSPPR